MDSRDGRPRQITASHLARRAVVYIRQSSEMQVREHQGSTMYQRDQVRFPRAWGWPADLIDEMDEDLGKSASSTIHRRGYQRMLGWISSGKAGAIFVADLNRLCRNLLDAVTLLEECKIHDVLIVVDGRVHDLRDRGDRLFATLVLNFSEFENDGRRETLRNGRIAKAAKGLAVSSPPAGYVAHKGHWSKDPDEQVRAAIRAALEAILQHRSLVKAVATLASEGFRLPRRSGHQVSWVAPDVGKLSFIARSCAYAGDYLFRRQRVDPALGRRGNGRLKERLSAPDERILIPDHHEPYVSRAEWAEIQHILDVNAPTKERRNLGPGPAVLQGVIRCQRHRGNLMSPRVKRVPTGRQYIYYCCPGERLHGGPPCGVVSGPPLERAVVEEITQRLTAPSLEAVRECWRQARHSALDERRRRELSLDRLRAQVKDLTRRHEHVDPANRRVAAALEAQLEVALRELDRVEEQADLHDEPLSDFTEKMFADLLVLCANFPALWNAPTTEAHDRKEIVRTVVSEVSVESVTSEQIQARIRWVDGGGDTRIVVNRPAHALRLIAEMAEAGLVPQEIADRLAGLRVTTRTSQPWNAKDVEAVMQRTRRRTAPKPG